MSPRPIELPKSGFETALKQARQGQCAEALKSVEHELAKRSDRESLGTLAAAALAEIARLAEASGDLKTAERALELGVELRPRYADLHYELACVYLSRQRRTEARRSLDAALRLNPRFTAARLERALLDAREGLIGEALESLRTLARDIPVGDPGAFQEGLKSLERAEWDDAEPLLKRALDVSDPGLKQRLERFREQLERGEAARAAQSLQEILPRYEGYPDLHYLIGLAGLKLGHYDDALSSLARALELNPDFHAARVQLAHALDCLGETAQAGEQLSLVLEHDPANHHALELQKSWSERGLRDRPRARASHAPAAAPLRPDDTARRPGRKRPPTGSTAHEPT